MLINIFKNLFKKSENPLELIDQSAKEKLESYRYGVKVGKRLKKHLIETKTEKISSSHLVDEDNLSYFLGLRKGLNDNTSSFTSKYIIKEIDNTYEVPFTLDNIKGKDFAKSEFKNTQIYLRHS